MLKVLAGLGIGCLATLDERITRYQPHIESVFDHPSLDLALHTDGFDVDPDIHMQATVLGPSLAYTFLSPEGAETFYDMIDPRVYNELMRQMNYNEPFYLVRTLTREFSVKSDWSILDAGCGTGTIG
jgi:hypothetical protein